VRRAVAGRPAGRSSTPSQSRLTAPAAGPAPQAAPARAAAPAAGPRSTERPAARADRGAGGNGGPEVNGGGGGGGGVNGRDRHHRDADDHDRAPAADGVDLRAGRRADLGGRPVGEHAVLVHGGRGRSGDQVAKSPETLDTTKTGTFAYTVTATSGDGQTGTASISYTVAAARSAQISSPASGVRFTRGQMVNASYGCLEGSHGPGIASCTGTVAAEIWSVRTVCPTALGSAPLACRQHSRVPRPGPRARAIIRIVVVGQ
jgi:hypothetical protein